MKLIFSVFSIAIGLSAVASPLERKGTDNNGNECVLVVEEWGFPKPEDSESWVFARMLVRSSYQGAESPSVEVGRSFTPQVLYGVNKDSGEQFSLFFGAGAAKPENIHSFTFQGRDAEGNLLQARCVLR